MHKIKEIPILKYLIPFILGILLSNIVQPSSLIVLLLSSIVFFSFLVNRHIATYLFIGATFFLISWTTFPHKTLQTLPINKSLSGVITADEIWKQTSTNAQIVAEFADQKIILYLQRKNCLVLPSDLIELEKIRIQALDTTAKNEFQSYHKYLISKGIGGTVFVNENNITAHLRKFSIKGEIYKWRYQLTSKIKGTKQLESDRESIFLALLLGEKSFLEAATKDAYRFSGVIHVLAISGLHVGMVYLFLQFFFNLLPLPFKGIELTVVLGVLVLYAIISGMGPSVLRAVLMCSLIQIGKYLQLKINSLNIVFSSALFLLVFDQNLLYDVGFQLSYSAVISILYFGPIYKKIKPKPTHWLHQWTSLKILDLIYLSVSASIGTFPVLLFHFKEIYYASIWNSILVVPLITIVVLLGLTAIICYSITPLFKGLLKACDYLLLICNSLISSSNSLGTPNFQFDVSIWTVFSFYFLIFLLTSKPGNTLVYYSKLTLSIVLLLFSGTALLAF